MQSIKNWCSVQFSKTSRLKQQKLKTKVLNIFPGAYLLLNLLLFSPFLLFGFIFIAGPYMIDDYVPTKCFVDKSLPLNDPGKQLFYQYLILNYTLNSENLRGFQQRCLFSTETERYKCSQLIPLEFDCLVDYSYTGKTDEKENEILTNEEFSKRNFNNSKSLSLLFFGIFGFAIISYTIIKLTFFIMEKYILEKITDKDLGISQMDEKDFSFKYREEVTDRLLDSKILLKSLSNTASENDEVVEWFYKPPASKLIRSSTWIIGIYIFIGIAPIIFLLIYFAIYSGFKFPWKLWGLITIEISIAYLIFLYLFFIWLYVFVIFRVFYYITTSRTICVVHCYLIYWVFEFPHSDIESVEKIGEKEGAIEVRSKQFQCSERLFSFVEDAEIVKILLTQKMDLIGNDIKINEEQLGESLNETEVIVNDIKEEKLDNPEEKLL